MALPSAVRGGLRPSLLIQWAARDGEPLNLSGAIITASIRDRVTGEVAPSAGVFVVTDAANGWFRWDFDASDVAATGVFDVWFTAGFDTGPTPARTFRTEWTVEEGY